MQGPKVFIKRKKNVINQQKGISLKYYYTIDKSVLNESMVDAFTTWFGRQFQSFMVRGKNE